MDDTTINKDKKKPKNTVSPSGQIQILFSVITEGKVWEQQSDGSQKQVFASTETFFIGGHVKKPIKIFERIIKRLLKMNYVKKTQQISNTEILGIDDPSNPGFEPITGTTGIASNLDPCFGFLANQGKGKWTCCFKYSNIEQQLRENLDSIPKVSTDWILLFFTSEKKDKKKELLSQKYCYTECNLASYLGSGFFLKSPSINRNIFIYIKDINQRQGERLPLKPTPAKYVHRLAPIEIAYIGGTTDDNYTITITDSFISFTEEKYNITDFLTGTIISSFRMWGENSNSGGTVGNIYGWIGIKAVAIWNPSDPDDAPFNHLAIVYSPGDLISRSVEDGYLVPSIKLDLLKKTNAYPMPDEMGPAPLIYQPFYYIFPESRWALPTFFGGINTSQSFIESKSQSIISGTFWQKPYFLTTQNTQRDYGRKLVTKGGTSAAGDFVERMVPEYGPLDGSLSFGVSVYDPPGTQPHYLLVRGSEFIPRGVGSAGVISDEPPRSETITTKATETVSLIYYGGKNGVTTGGEGSVISYKVGSETINERIVITSNQDKSKFIEFSSAQLTDNVFLKELTPAFTQVGLDFYNVEDVSRIGNTSKIWTKDDNYKVAKYEYKNGKYVKTIKEYKAFSFGYTDKNKPTVCMIHAYSFHPS